MNRDMAKEQERFIRQNFEMMWEQVWLSIKHERLDLMFTCKFFMGASDFVEKKDQTAVKSVLYKTSRNLALTSLLGLTLNVQFKRVPKVNFLKWPFFARYPTRLFQFLSPNVIFMNSHQDALSTVEEMVIKYHRRLDYFQKTNNYQYMDPTGELFEDFKAKNMGIAG